MALTWGGGKLKGEGSTTPISWGKPELLGGGGGGGGLPPLIGETLTVRLCSYHNDGKTDHSRSGILVEHVYYRQTWNIEEVITAYHTSKKLMLHVYPNIYPFTFKFMKNI